MSEVLLASQLVKQSKVRCTFITLAYLNEKFGKIEITPKRLRTYCELSNRDLSVHLAILQDVGLISCEGKGKLKIVITHDDAHHQVAFGFSEDGQAYLDTIGLLPTHKYSTAQFQKGVDAYRKRRMGDKTYKEHEKLKKKNNCSPKMRKKVREAMQYYDDIKAQYLDRQRPDNREKTMQEIYSTVLPRGDSVTSSKHFGSFQKVIEQAEFNDATVKDWIRAQFVGLDEIPYPNHLIGKGALHRLHEAKSIGIL